MKNVHMCELCDQRAALYCSSDSAFLCFRCDSRVHTANFLVARHIRHPLCSTCKSLAGHPISGDVVPASDHWLCSSCSPEDDDDDTLSSSSSLDSMCSACVSSTESSATTTTTTKLCLRRSGSSVTEEKAESSSLGLLSSRFTRRKVKSRARSAGARFEGSFVNWCKKLGMMSDDDYADVVSSACDALGFCMARLHGVPLRVSLAASFWFGVRVSGERRVSTWQNLRRVEEISGVPVKLILAVDAKLGRELRVMRRGRAELEEGWAEC